MSEGFRQSMAWLHTWAGLLFGWLLFAIFFTGTLAVFDKEISHWMRPELHGAASTSDAAGLVARVLTTEAAEADRWSVTFPSERDPTLRVAWPAPKSAATERILDPATGKKISPRGTHGGNFFYVFHYSLFMGLAGIWIVGAATMAMLIALVTGLVIHRRIFRDFFTFRPRGVALRSWLDAHNITGVLVLPFHLMITYTGLVIFYAVYMPAGIHALYNGDAGALFADLLPRVERKRTGTPAPMIPLDQLVAKAEKYFGTGMVASLTVQNPGDAHAQVDIFRRRDDQLARISDGMTLDGATGEILDIRAEHRTSYLTQRVLAGLHYVQFGGYTVRWLYFVSGLASSAMIATGLVLWTIKRRRKYLAGSSNSFGFRVAEALNVAAVSGLVIACVAYLWANRLLPADLATRMTWESRIFFYTWLACLCHAFLRCNVQRAWIEQLSLAALLCIGLPLLDLSTTESHLGATISNDDWLVAGVDLTVLALGLLMAWTTWKVASSHSHTQTGKPIVTTEPTITQDP